MGRPPSVSLEKFTTVRSDPDSVRQAFRVPVDKGIKAVLNGKEYEVADISAQGIRIRCTDSTAFTVAQTIRDSRLILPGQTIDGLTARVIHFSCRSEGEWTNGLQWVDLPDAAQEKIAEQVSRLKRVLTGSGPDSPGSSPGETA